MDGWRGVVAVALGAGLLAAGVWALGRSEQAPPRASAPDSAPAAGSGAPAEVDALRQALAAEQRKSRDLADENEWLRQQLSALAAGYAESGDEGPDAAELETDESGHPARADFDAEKLARAGVPAEEIEHLRRAIDSYRMRMLEHSHTATRENWREEPRYSRGLLAIHAEMRLELGDNGYDLYLYGTGRNNRAVVRNVLRDSPAERAGFRPGDIVVSYGDRRIFRGQELRSATTRGGLGETVTVDVLRNGEELRLYATRGALGVDLQNVRRVPEIRW